MGGELQLGIAIGVAATLAVRAWIDWLRVGDEKERLRCAANDETRAFANGWNKCAETFHRMWEALDRKELAEMAQKAKLGGEDYDNPCNNTS